MNISQSKIKIAYILPMFAIGGAERIVVDLIKNIDKNKFDIILVCLRDNEARLSYWKEELEKAGVRIKMMGVDDGHILHYFLRVIQIFKLAHFLRKEKIDIVHTHLMSADVIGFLAAKIARIKIIISTEHNEVLVPGIIKRSIKKVTNKFFTRLVAVSDAVKEAVVRLSGAPRKNTIVIRNGIEIDKYLFPGRSYDRAGKIIIGAMGRLTKQKGFDLLVAAAAKIKSDNFIINIAGDRDFHEDLREDLENQIIASGLSEKIKLVGLQKDADAFYRQLDIFVMSSRWEGLPVVLLEAGLSGLPVVVPDIGGITEVIKAEETGLIYKKKDVDAMAKSLELLINNRPERERLGSNLRVEITKNFSVKKMAEEHERLYLELTNL